MGRVRTNAVKKAARHIIEKYYPRLTTDFHVNKRIAEEVAIIPSKRLRNKIAGYLSHLMRRIEKGPVRGISFKLQVCLFPVASFFILFALCLSLFLHCTLFCTKLRRLLTSSLRV